jgi:hypothetical protein
MKFKHKWQAIMIAKITWIYKMLTNKNVNSITTTTLITYPDKKWSYVQTINFKNK